MRSVWHGAVAFGMVSIDVKAYTATEDKSVRFKQVHPGCESVCDPTQPTKQLMECTGCEAKITRGDTGKAYPVSETQLLLMEESDFDNLPLQSVKAIDVTAFAPADTVPTVALEKSYYLAPQGASVKAFRLLWEAMAVGELPLVAIGKVSLRSGRESPCLLRQHGRLMLLQTLMWPDEIRSPAGLEEDMPDTNIDSAELKLASQLVEAMMHDDAAPVFVEMDDHYRDELLGLIQRKLEGKELPTSISVERQQASLLEELAASVEAHQAS